MTYPTTWPVWATDPGANVGSIPAGLTAFGWQMGVPVMSPQLNEWQKEVGVCLTYLSGVLPSNDTLRIRHIVGNQSLDILVSGVGQNLQFGTVDGTHENLLTFNRDTYNATWISQGGVYWNDFGPVTTVQYGVTAGPHPLSGLRYSYNAGESLKCAASVTGGGWQYRCFNDTPIGPIVSYLLHSTNGWSLVGDSTNGGAGDTFDLELRWLDTYADRSAHVFVATEIGMRVDETVSNRFTMSLVKVDRSTRAETTVASVSTTNGGGGVQNFVATIANVALTLSTHSYRLRMTCDDSFRTQPISDVWYTLTKHAAG